MRRDEKCMFALRACFVLGMLLALTAFPLVIVPVKGVSEEIQLQASSALADGDAAVILAYEAVANASASGANVSDLLARLNEAGELLTRAHAAYRLGDFDSALKLANLCQERLTGFVADADALTEVAVRDRNLDFMVNVVGSIVGSVAVVCCGLFVWFHLDRRYRKTGGQVQ